MKRILLIFITLINIATSASASYADTLTVANVLCQDGKFKEAAAKYEAVLASGNENVSVYYNLGYAYYKQGMLAKAILNFERAKRLAPGDADIQFNLEQAYEMTDKMQVIEPVFFVRWWESLCNSMSSDGWAITFIIVFVLMLVSIAAFLFADSIGLRKTGFFSAIVLFFIAIASISISVRQKGLITDSHSAIIVKSSSTLNTTPDKNGTEMVVLHEGTPVYILSEVGDWYEVRLRDGNVGWIRKTDIEKI